MFPDFPHNSVTMKLFFSFKISLTLEDLHELCLRARAVRSNKILSRVYKCNYLLAIAMQFQGIFFTSLHIKISVCFVVAMQQLLKNCRKVKSFEYSDSFFYWHILTALSVARLQLFPHDGNAIVSENCIAIASEKCPCSFSFN